MPSEVRWTTNHFLDHFVCPLFTLGQNFISHSNDSVEFGHLNFQTFQVQ